MPLEFTTAGLTIQPFDEIVGEMNADYRGAFGNNVDVSPSSPFGQEIAIQAEREALLQQKLLAVYEGRSANDAVGNQLDQIGEYNDIARKEATQSVAIAKGLITGTLATAIENGRQVRLIQTGDIWEIVNGPYVIPGGGTIACDIRALVTGPKVFQTTSPVDVDPNGWEIVTTVVGWDTFETTADIDPEETGRDIESDLAYRERRKVEILKTGNDLAAIKAAVSAVVGVTSVRVFENINCLVVVDGIPGGAFEVVVEGGLDADIADAILSAKPPGAESFGTILTVLPNGEGGTITVGHTRPVDVDVFVTITVDTTGAEGQFPSNGAQAIEDAFLASANGGNTVAKDVIPQSFYGVVFASVIDPISGLDTIVSAVVAMDIAPAPTLEDPILIAIREKADFDSTRTSVVVI